MFQRLKEWVHRRGGRVIYLGGNGINCEVELRDDATMVCRNQIVDEPGADEGPKYESRFHRSGESEASLLGVVYDEAGIMTAAPYRVVDASHWAFAGTGLRNGDTFGEKSLHERIPGGASGHETDKRSASSPAGTILLARGENPDDGGAEMTCYQLVNGGGVFAVGSITYVASLLVDDRVSRITANVLSRFLGG